MKESHSDSYTSFDGHRRLATGSLQTSALAVRRASENTAAGPFLIIDNATGRPVDIDIRGSEEEVVAKLTSAASAQTEAVSQSDTSEPCRSRGRGRPKLGVTAREVTLLPRHWEWLAGQPGGASVALRKLVEEARRANSEKEKVRKALERAYYFMLAVAGDLPGFEEATRALFASEPVKFQGLIAAWPSDIREHAMQLAFTD
ncbi:DUF2239 family protein [Pantoea sp. S62]|uniref:DUF2239 family protein n=1 Tax=Pantoea sp. S62 TaxID=2769342 RepID=UPI00191235F1|nr:DUF2239 family protein [Pantoea sp. S62]MBK5017243.1 DUF2239 family protein [Pantoea sp. S62]